MILKHLYNIINKAKFVYDLALFLGSLLGGIKAWFCKHIFNYNTNLRNKIDDNN